MIYTRLCKRYVGSHEGQGWNSFGVFVFPSSCLYHAGRCILGRSCGMKSEIKDHDVLGPLRHFGKTNKLV